MSMIDETDNAMRKCESCDRICFEPKPYVAFGPEYCAECRIEMEQDDANERVLDEAFPLPKRCAVCLQYDLPDEFIRVFEYDNATGEMGFDAHRSCHETGHRALEVCEVCHWPKSVAVEYPECRPAKEYQWVGGFQIPGPSHGEHSYVTVTVAGNSPALDAMRAAS